VLSLLNQGTAYFLKTGKPTVDFKILSADKLYEIRVIQAIIIKPPITMEVQQIGIKSPLNFN
jgi:hypothetical protein